MKEWKSICKSFGKSVPNLAFWKKYKSDDEFVGHAVKILFPICLASNLMVSRQTRQGNVACLGPFSATIYRFPKRRNNSRSPMSKYLDFTTSWLKVPEAKLFWDYENLDFLVLLQVFPTEFFQGCFSDATIFPSCSTFDPKKITQQMAEMGPRPEGCTISVIVGTSIGVRWDFSLGCFDDIFLKVIPPSCCYELSMPDISPWFKHCISPCIQNYWEIPGCRQMSTTWFMESKQFCYIFSS